VTSLPWLSTPVHCAPDVQKTWWISPVLSTGVTARGGVRRRVDGVGVALLVDDFAGGRGGAGKAVERVSRHRDRRRSTGERSKVDRFAVGCR